MPPTNEPSVFTPAERAYLLTMKLGRLATIDQAGRPQVRPVGFIVRAGGIDIGGIDLARTRKFQNIRSNPQVAFVVDDIASTDPWKVRGVEIRGVAEAVDDPDSPLIRIQPRRIITWGLGEHTGARSREVARRRA
jgi:pyridoxamine 5'-phosphate oxidase family protein